MRQGKITRRGFALADFLTGTMIFAGALVGFTTLTSSKFEMIHQASSEQVVKGQLESSLDLLRRDGLPAKPDLSKTDRDGYQWVAERKLKLRGLEAATETTSVRPLVHFDAAGRRLIETEVYEVQVKLTWQGGQRSLSGALPQGGSK